MKENQRKKWNNIRRRSWEYIPLPFWRFHPGLNHGIDRGCSLLARKEKLNVSVSSRTKESSWRHLPTKLTNELHEFIRQLVENRTVFWSRLLQCRSCLLQLLKNAPSEASSPWSIRSSSSSDKDITKTSGHVEKEVVRDKFMSHTSIDTRMYRGWSTHHRWFGSTAIGHLVESILAREAFRRRC